MSDLAVDVDVTDADIEVMTASQTFYSRMFLQAGVGTVVAMGSLMVAHASAVIDHTSSASNAAQPELELSPHLLTRSLVALRKYEKDEFICVYGGTVVSAEEAYALSDKRFLTNAPPHFIVDGHPDRSGAPEVLTFSSFAVGQFCNSTLPSCSRKSSDSDCPDCPFVPGNANMLHLGDKNNATDFPFINIIRATREILPLEEIVWPYIKTQSHLSTMQIANK